MTGLPAEREVRRRQPCREVAVEGDQGVGLKLGARKIPSVAQSVPVVFHSDLGCNLSRDSVAEQAHPQLSQAPGQSSAAACVR